MTKDTERVTFRVDDDLKQFVDGDESLNTSGLMRSLLKNYVRMGDVVEASLERRLKDKEKELDDKKLEKRRLENEIDEIEREINRIEQRIQERRKSTPEEVVEFAEKIKSGAFARDQLTPENEALLNWSQKAGLPPEKFIQLVEERL